jgi:hypothetical protein
MLDLIEGAKLIYGFCGTGIATSSNGDWIKTENMQCVWAICNEEANAKFGFFSGYVAEDVDGTNAARATCQYWYSTGIEIDKMVASTATTGQALTVNGGVVAVRFDPAAAESSQPYFSVGYTTSKGVKSIMYLGQPRYGGLGQILATSSST